MDNEKLEELSIVIQDRIRSVSKGWWYALAIMLLACIPLYYILQSSFTSVIVSSHKYPAFIYQVAQKQPLQVLDKQVFQLTDNTYSGFIKLQNTNLEYGVADQPYTAVFLTTGGTEVTRVAGSVYVLPSSEKLVVFPKFTASSTPTDIQLSLGETKFIHAPLDKSAPNLEIQRLSLQQADNQFVVSASVTNKTAFTITQVGLPVLLYDKSNTIVGASYTNINDLLYQETRSFQFSWPTNPQAVRAEILPEVDIFQNGIYVLPPGSSQFDTQSGNP